MATTPASEFGVYSKEGHEDRTPLDQAEVNQLVWQGYQPATTGTKGKSTAKGTDA